MAFCLLDSPSIHKLLEEHLLLVSSVLQRQQFGSMSSEVSLICFQQRRFDSILRPCQRRCNLRNPEQIRVGFYRLDTFDSKSSSMVITIGYTTGSTNEGLEETLGRSFN